MQFAQFPKLVSLSVPYQLQNLTSGAHLHAHFATTTSRLPNATNHPYPTNPRPTPNQIFHLPAGASQKEVKSRYYDLVRLHHPDSPHSRVSNLPQKVKEERFRSITNAYDILRGKKSASHRPWNGPERDWRFKDELERRRRRADVHSNVYGSGSSGWTEGRGAWTANPDDRDKDKFIIAVGVLCLAIAVGPALVWSHHNNLEAHHLSASANLAQARKEAREFGRERRTEIKKRVAEFKKDKRYDEGQGESGDISR